MRTACRLLSVLTLCTLPIVALDCTLDERAWTQHCAIAEDCTSEPTFCPCCTMHPATEWADACQVICGDGEGDAGGSVDDVAYSGNYWRFEDFGQTEEAIDAPGGYDNGPHFEQPALSLAGDAAVVMGDCYNLDVRVKERTDGGQDACLVPPVAPRLFGSDERLRLNLTVCPSTVAPFHIHDTQPAALAAMMCFDECRVVNATAPPVPPTFVDVEALQIANCTRRCLAECVHTLSGRALTLPSRMQEPAHVDSMRRPALQQDRRCHTDGARGMRRAGASSPPRRLAPPYVDRQTTLALPPVIERIGPVACQWRGAIFSHSAWTRTWRAASTSSTPTTTAWASATPRAMKSYGFRNAQYTVCARVACVCTAAGTCVAHTCANALAMSAHP